MAELKNIRIAVSGIYDYALEELPTLRIPLPRRGAPDWAEEKRIYKVYRPAAVLAVACPKFANLPMTHHHPKTPVDGQNFRDLAIGWTGEHPEVDYIAETNEVGIKSTCMLYDDEALNAYQNGEVQLSPGYIATFEWQKGKAPDGQEYDIIMREITDVNHLALLPAGRGGEYAVVMDEAPKTKSVFDLARENLKLTVFDYARITIDARKTYNPGDISEKTGLQKKADGSWGAPEGSAEKKELKIKKGLKKTEEIADYFETTLAKYGVETERKHSGLSGSEYIIIKGEGDKFGKAEVDDVEIRISNHNLPPSYDKAHAGDFDVRSEGVSRSGTNGDANDYDEVLKQIISKVSVENKSERAKKKDSQEEKEAKERNKRVNALLQKEQMEINKRFDKAKGNREAIDLLNKFYKKDGERYVQNKDTDVMERIKAMDELQSLGVW